jgi:hypothetical protein
MTTNNLESNEPNNQSRNPRIPIEDILNNYPIDREKLRDVLFLEISKNLQRIANSLEKFINEPLPEETNDKSV